MQKDKMARGNEEFNKLLLNFFFHIFLYFFYKFFFFYIFIDKRAPSFFFLYIFLNINNKFTLFKITSHSLPENEIIHWYA